MKKFKIASFTLLMFLVFPAICLAINYDIENYYIDVYLKKDGSMSVSELIIMDGTFNGYEIGIDIDSSNIYGASNLKLDYIGGLTNIKDCSWDLFNADFAEFKLNNNADIGDILKYKEVDTNKYRLYYKTNNNKTAFLLKYTLEDVLILHKDVGEIYWNFFSDSFKDDVNNLEIKVHLPENIDLEDFNYWFHGSLSGTSSYQDGIIYAKLKKLKALSPLDFRILMAPDILNTNSINKKDDATVKDDIIKKEDEIVAHDLKEIKRVKIIFYTVEYLTVIFYIVLIIVWIYVYIKYDKERKAKYFSKYNREFIDDYNVEVIDYLMNKNITPNAMSASIMNLIYKKKISYEAVDKKKNDYLFKLLNTDDLNESEMRLVKFLFDKIGNGESFTIKQLKKYAKSPHTSQRFINSYNSWKDSVIKDANKQKFFEVKKNIAKFGFIIFGLSALIILICLVYAVEFIAAYSTVIFAIAFIVYLCSFSKKTEKGIEHYTKWRAFKNFLADFGSFELKELPEIVLWERYLVYATVFGLADKVEKSMNVKIKEFDLETPDIYMMPTTHIGPIINNSITSAYQNAHIAVNSENASSSGGSFGGHGGGFSSGGGFGGGGRSGGGF